MEPVVQTKVGFEEFMVESLLQGQMEMPLVHSRHWHKLELVQLHKDLELAIHKLYQNAADLAELRNLLYKRLPPADDDIPF